VISKWKQNVRAVPFGRRKAQERFEYTAAQMKNNNSYEKTYKLKHRGELIVCKLAA